MRVDFFYCLVKLILKVQLWKVVLLKEIVGDWEEGAEEEEGTEEEEGAATVKVWLEREPPAIISATSLLAFLLSLMYPSTTESLFHPPALFKLVREIPASAKRVAAETRREWPV